MRSGRLADKAVGTGVIAEPGRKSGSSQVSAAVDPTSDVAHDADPHIGDLKGERYGPSHAGLAG